MNTNNFNNSGFGTTSTVPVPGVSTSVPLKPTPEVKKININTAAAKFRHLSGAGIRRLKRLLENGVPMEQAQWRAMHPIRPVSRKMQTITTPLPEINAPKPQPGIIIGVLHSDHPNIKLTPEDLVTIEELIVDKIVELGRGAVLKPKFQKIIHGDGFLELTCADRATAEWLKRLEHKLKPWSGASLAIKEDTVYTPRILILGHFPYREKFNDEKMFQLIDAQNEGIYSYTWQVLDKTLSHDLKSLKIIFSVDEECYKLLKKKKLQINYQFGYVKVLPCVEPPAPTQPLPRNHANL